MVISQLNSALAVSGLQTMHALEQGMHGGGGLIARASASPSKQVRKRCSSYELHVLGLLSLWP